MSDFSTQAATNANETSAISKSRAGPDLGTATFQGFYAETMLFLTGEHRSWNPKTATFNRVITRNPDHVTAHFMLAVIHSETGHSEAARTEYREILRISPHFTLANVRERIPYQNQDTVARIVTALQEAVN